MPQNTTANQYFEAERILDERTTEDTTFYLIKWKGMNNNGKPWEPTWEPASHCTQPLIASWNHNRAGKRKLRSPIFPSSPSTTPTKNSPIKRERKLQKTVAGSNPANNGDSLESPMVIDSDDDASRNPTQNDNTHPSSKLRQTDDSSSVANSVAVKHSKIHRQLLRPYQILLPVPLSKLQQIAYRKAIDKPQIFKYLAETNLSTPPEPNSIIFHVKDQLLKIVNHLSLLLSSSPNHYHGPNTSYQSFETGKLVMINHLLKGLRHHDLTIGIAIPQGPIMNSIIKDFMKTHNHNYVILNETANRRTTRLTTNEYKLRCIVFTTPLPRMNEEELPQFDLVIAYDTSFSPRKHLWHIKANENIPIIRLVTKLTLEHALNYQMLQQSDNLLFSTLSLFEIKRIIQFGLWKKNQCIETGCELRQFDIQGTCDKVFQWINDGMQRNLTFGMEAAVEKVWGKSIPAEHVTFDRSRLIATASSSKERKDFSSPKAEKRVSDVNDEGSLKKRKDKETSQNEELSQRKKKLKTTEGISTEVSNPNSINDSNHAATSSLSISTSTILSPTEPLTESPIEQINSTILNKSKQIPSPRNSRDELHKDSRRSSLKDSSKDLLGKNKETTQDSCKDHPSTSKNPTREISRNLSKDPIKHVKGGSKDSNKNCKEQENAIDWKQKYSELLKLQDDLTQEKERYCKMVNDLSSDLAKTRTQLGELQIRRKRSLFEVQSIELEKVRMEMADVQLENSRLKSDAENKEQETHKLRKEVETLKNSVKTYKSKIKSLETENNNLKQTKTVQSTFGKSSKKNESFEDQIKRLEKENSVLQLQCDLQKQELKLAHEEDQYHQDIANLLMKMKGKTKEEMDEIYLAKKRTAALSKSNVNTPSSSSKGATSDITENVAKNVPENVPKNAPENATVNVPVNVPVVDNNVNGTSTNVTKLVSNTSNEVSPSVVNLISSTTTKTFACNWDKCKKAFEKKEDLKIHLKSFHNLDPGSSHVIEIID
ncbi:10773_t:CDS:2 [Funneliformis geosporum]|nr:10773_t:CDS:2 [Funneliformis geosporum]